MQDEETLYWLLLSMSNGTKCLIAVIYFPELTRGDTCITAHFGILFWGMFSRWPGILAVRLTMPQKQNGLVFHVTHTHKYLSLIKLFLNCL